MNLGRAELACKKTMLKLLYDFNTTYSAKASFVRCSNGIVLDGNLFNFDSNKQIELLKKALGGLVGHGI